MAQIHCSRCKQEKDALQRAPLPGDLGEQLVAQTCVGCWQEWLRAQVILINEESLSPAKPDEYRRLTEQMSAFLELH